MCANPFKAVLLQEGQTSCAARMDNRKTDCDRLILFARSSTIQVCLCLTRHCPEKWAIPLLERCQIQTHIAEPGVFTGVFGVQMGDASYRAARALFEWSLSGLATAKREIDCRPNVRSHASHVLSRLDTSSTISSFSLFLYSLGELARINCLAPSN